MDVQNSKEPSLESPVSPGYTASIGENGSSRHEVLEGCDGSSSQHGHEIVEGLPFRAIDLLDGQPCFLHTLQPQPQFDMPYSFADSGADGPLFGAPDALGETAEVFGASASVGDASEESIEIIELEAESPAEGHAEQGTAGPVVSSQTWNEMVAASFAQFRQVPSSLLLPWEQGPMAAVFDFDADPQCPGIAERMPMAMAGNSGSLQKQLTSFLLPEDAKYLHAVKSIQDMNYFEASRNNLSLHAVNGCASCR